MPRQPSGFICPKISAGVLSCRDFPKRQIEPNTAIADLGALPSPPAQQAPVAQSNRGAFFHCRDHHFKERFFNYSLVFLLPHNGSVHVALGLSCTDCQTFWLFINSSNIPNSFRPPNAICTMLWGGFISFAVAGSNLPTKGLAVILSLPDKMQNIHFIPGVYIIWFFLFTTIKGRQQSVCTARHLHFCEEV
jgi:hypothetical protein